VMYANASSGLRAISTLCVIGATVPPRVGIRRDDPAPRD
jgi:hypothetical protein